MRQIPRSTERVSNFVIIGTADF